MSGLVAHYVKKNETTRTPNRWVFLDTEAINVELDGKDVQSWRLAVTQTVHRDSHAAKWTVSDHIHHGTPEELWDDVEKFCRKGARTICVAHGMGYDARISRALELLPSLGWTLERWQVGDKGCCLRWRKEGMALWLLDSLALLPLVLEKVGSLIKIDKLDLPAWGDSDELWWRRCETDVTILRTAFMDIVDWVREDDLGNWQPTAGSMAWANWRHRHYTDNVLVHDNVAARKAERYAGYSGRCEAWQWGDLPGGSWTEYDMPLAYPTVCLSERLPVRLVGHVRVATFKYVDRRGPNKRWLLKAKVRTEMPVLPVRHDGRVLWPVGEFEGWWWDNELDLARASGAEVTLGEGYRYHATPALADWAEWVISYVNGRESGTTPLRELVAKSWARALVGRFGTKYRVWEDAGISEVPGVRMDGLIDYATKAEGQLLHIMGRAYSGMEEVDGAESSPAIMSAIMSESRIRLWQTMQTAGMENVAYVDTDSAIVNHKGAERIKTADERGELHGIRIKGAWHSLTVMGPRQLIVDGGHRINGVRKGAERIAPREWVGERWEGMEAALKNGRADRVVITPTKWKVEGVDHRRLHLPGGATAPVRLELDPTGVTIRSAVQQAR